MEKQEVNPILLVVEDEEALRELIKETLTGMYTIVGAKCAEDAFGLLESQEVNVIGCVLTDLNMGAMTGVDLLKKIKESPTLKHIPVVVMSGRFGDGGNPSRIALKEMDAAATIQKPFTSEDLLEVIQMALTLGKPRN